MMKKRYILWVLLMWLAGISAAAQTTDDNDSTTTDFFVADTLSVDTLMLSWPQSVQVGIDRLLADEMFKTSQVAVMVYDLDADSAIYRFNERQLLRPVLIALKPNFAIQEKLKTLHSRVIFTVWAASTRVLTPMICMLLSKACAKWVSTPFGADFMPTKA